MDDGTDPNTQSSGVDASPVMDLKARNASSARAWMMLIGGLVLLLATLAITALVILSPQAGNPGYLGAMVVVPVFMLLGGIGQLRAHRRVLVTERTLILVRAGGARRVPWSSIASVRVQQDTAIGYQPKQKSPRKSKDAPPRQPDRVMTLTDENGRRIDRVRSTHFERFDDLLAEVEIRSSDARGTPTRSIDDEARVASRNGRRTGVLMVAFGLFMTAGCVFLSFEERNRVLHERALNASAVTVSAEVVDHRMHNGIAPRLEYRFTDPAGVVREKDVMVDPAEWEQLRGQTHTEVVYAASDPSIHRLARGEVDPSGVSPPMTIVLIVVAGAVGLFLILGGALMSIGFDIGFEHGRVFVRRTGTTMGD